MTAKAEGPADSAQPAAPDGTEPQRWRQAVVDVDAPLCEPLAAALVRCGALGIEIVDDQTRAMPGQGARLTKRATLVAPFDERPGLEAEIAAELTRTVTAVGIDGNLELAFSYVYDEDYNAAFKASWTPFFITERAAVIPSWTPAAERPDADISIDIDPGAAFGTGTHETTRLCAQVITDIIEAKPVPLLLDVGTGSGILSILALKLGAERAVGTEIDRMALDAAVRNAADNGVGERFVSALDMPHTALEHAAISHAPLIVANILIDALLMLKDSIASCAGPGTTLVLSGLLVGQADAAVRAYHSVGFAERARPVDGDWCAVVLDYAG